MLDDGPLHNSVKTGAMEMGRKSAFFLGECTLGIGRMEAVLRCCGTVEVDSERLNSRSGAPIV